MLDIKFVRANPDAVKENIQKKDVYKRQSRACSPCSLPVLPASVPNANLTPSCRAAATTSL